jgi:hypothetical protein
MGLVCRIDQKVGYFLEGLERESTVISLSAAIGLSLIGGIIIILSVLEGE